MQRDGDSRNADGWKTNMADVEKRTSQASTDETVTKEEYSF